MKPEAPLVFHNHFDRLQSAIYSGSQSTAFISLGQESWGPINGITLQQELYLEFSVTFLCQSNIYVFFVCLFVFVSSSHMLKSI